MTATSLDSVALLRRMFDAAVAAALPSRIIANALPSPPNYQSGGRTIVLGAGKASAAMAQALEQSWNGPLEGLVVTRYGHAVPCKHIEIVEAAHPVPDETGRTAAARILALAETAGQNDLVIFLISGGGSALLTLPAHGISFEDKQVITHALLKSGADIAKINTVRRHLSAIKGGRLGRAASPARQVTLVISDVPGDDVSAIASGPTVPDPTTRADALAVLREFKIDVPPSILHHLKEANSEIQKPGDESLAGIDVRLIATPLASLEAAAGIAREAGFTPLILGDSIEGEASEVAKVMAGIALSAAANGRPVQPPCVLLSGGETTVTVKGKGCGGRNVEFLLALAIALNGASDICAIAADTDGIDGAGEAAGAIIAPDTLARARTLGLDAATYLHRNDAHAFFAALGDVVVTGPTLTNVNDFRAILIGRT